MATDPPSTNPIKMPDRVITGSNPAPRAWDYLFGLRPEGWIRLKLKSGGWLAGAYAVQEDDLRSYASGYPEKQDLFLVDMAEVDPEWPKRTASGLQAAASAAIASAEYVVRRPVVKSASIRWTSWPSAARGCA